LTENFSADNITFQWAAAYWEFPILVQRVYRLFQNQLIVACMWGISHAHSLLPFSCTRFIRLAFISDLSMAHRVIF